MTIKTIDFSHNSSEVLGRSAMSTRTFRDGEPSTITPDRILLDGRYSVGMRLVAAWAWGQAITWVFRVGDIQKQLTLTAGQWRTLAAEMRGAGFMAQRKEMLPGDAIPTHCLVFNFTIFDGCQHDSNSREVLKTTARERSGKQQLARGVENDKLNQGFKKPLFNKPPPSGGGEGKEVDQEEVQGQLAALAALAALDQAEARRFIKAAAGASLEQRQLLAAQLPRALETAQVKAAVAVSMAKNAAAGALTGQAGRPAPGTMLAQLDGLDGWVLSGPNGPLARVEGRGLRAIRQPGEPFFHPDKAVELVTRWKEGELNCEQQGDPAQLGRGAGPQALRAKEACAALAHPLSSP